MMLVKQLSIFVENKFGRLGAVLKILSDNQINIRALSIADTTDFGILRLVVNKPELAERILKENGFTVKCTSVIAAAAQDHPGGLYGVIDALRQNGITIEYSYGCIGEVDGYGLVILYVDQPEEAVSALMKSGVIVFDAEKLYKL